MMALAGVMKGSGKSIIATARKMAEIVWVMLNDKQDFDSNKMLGKYKPMNLFEAKLESVKYTIQSMSNMGE